MKEIPKNLPEKSDGTRMTEEEYTKIINARDSFMAFFMAKDFTLEECEAALDMVRSELRAIIRRSKLKKEE